MLLAFLFYGYATSVFSSRKLERATYDSVAFRYIASNDHTDHNTIATFRKRFLADLTPLFIQTLLIAHQMNVLKLGKISLDGTKIKANAMPKNWQTSRRNSSRARTKSKKQGRRLAVSPKPPEAELELRDKDQVSLTDEESRIMPTPSVDVDAMLVVGQHFT